MGKQNKIKSAREQALKDIAEYLKEDIATDAHNTDKLIVSATQLNNKLNRYLNRLLKLNTVNYKGNTNSKK